MVKKIIGACTKIELKVRKKVIHEVFLACFDRFWLRAAQVWLFSRRRVAADWAWSEFSLWARGSRASPRLRRLEMASLASERRRRQIVWRRMRSQWLRQRRSQRTPHACGAHPPTPHVRTHGAPRTRKVSQHFHFTSQQNLHLFSQNRGVLFCFFEEKKKFWRLFYSRNNT